MTLLHWTSIRLYVILNTNILKHTETLMPNITEMNPTEFRELLHTLVNEELFKSRKRLAALLAKDSPQEALEAEFFHFHGDYVDFAFWLERYEEDPLEGLTPDAPLAINHTFLAYEKYLCHNSCQC